MGRKSLNGQKQNTITLILTQEESNSLKVFETHKHIYDFFQKTGEIVNLHPHIKQELLDAIRVFQPYYFVNLNCPACIVDFLNDVYRIYQEKSI